MSTVLFDLDGTITDSARGIVDSFLHALDVVGAPRPEDDVLRGVVGPPIVHTFRRLGLDDTELRLARAAYRERYDSRGWSESIVYPGMPELLDRVSASGVTMGVATSKNERMARHILRHFDLDGSFTFIGGASDDDSRIEKADVVAHTLRQLGRRPVLAMDGGTPGVVPVGDRSHDVQGAVRYGIPTVLVAWGYGTPDDRDPPRGPCPPRTSSALSSRASRPGRRPLVRTGGGPPGSRSGGPRTVPYQPRDASLGRR